MVELDAFNALSPPVRSPDDGSGWHPAHRLGRRGKAADGRRNLPAALLVSSAWRYSPRSAAPWRDVRRARPQLSLRVYRATQANPARSQAIDLAQHTVAITAYPCADGGRRHDDFRLSGNRDSVAVDPVGSGVGASATLVRGGADPRKPKGATQQLL